MIKIVFEKDKNRVAAYDDSVEVGELSFRRRDDYWVLDHTYVDRKYRGQQIAEKMMALTMEEVKAAETKIVPQCSFARKECDLNEEYQKMLYQQD